MACNVKCVTLGDGAVGKTALMVSYTQKAFKNVPVVLVGTKIDLRGEKEFADSAVSAESGRALAKEVGAEAYCECSALTQEGLSDVFNVVIRAAMEPRKGEKD